MATDVISVNERLNLLGAFAAFGVLARGSIATAALAPAFAVVFASAATAQAVDLGRPAATTPRIVAADSVRPSVPLFSMHDAVVSVGVAATAVGMMAADRSVARSFQRRSPQSNSGLRRTLNVFNLLGDPGVIVFSAGSYFLGLGMHSRPVAALGMHTGEAIVMSGVLVEILKGSFGRARPYVDGTRPHNFNFGKGFVSDDYASCPSGDVTLAFTAATAASREVAQAWPGASRYVTPASYAAASIVGIARVYKNKHWASDVVAGAGVGTLSGILFERYNLTYPDNVFNRVFLPVSIGPARGGAQVAWSIPIQ
ncbi:MAG: phosphatase PAP2 family protein [Gemmatimonadaceae bacterium]